MTFHFRKIDFLFTFDLELTTPTFFGYRVRERFFFPLII